MKTDDGYSAVHREHMEHELKHQNQEWKALNRHHPYAAWDRFVLVASWIVGIIISLAAWVVIVHEIYLRWPRG